MTRTFEGSGWGFGYQANVGVAYEIVDAVALTLGYKFFGTLETEVTDAAKTATTTTCTSSRPCWRTAPSWASASGSRRPGPHERESQAGFPCGEPACCHCDQAAPAAHHRQVLGDST